MTSHKSQIAIGSILYLTCTSGFGSSLSFSLSRARSLFLSLILQGIDESFFIHQPLIYSHFAHGVGEPRYSQVSDWEKLQKTLTDALEHYNELHANMNLVLFEEAMHHM